MHHLLLIIILAISLPSLAREADDLTVARQLISQQQFASAHIILEGAIQRDGLLPPLVLAFTDNLLKNHFQQRAYTTFYLRDKLNEADSSRVTASGRHPERLLGKLLENNSGAAKAH